jgi:hypothetical protein
VSRLREGPLGVDVAAEPDYEDPPALLGDTVVGGVDQACDDPVLKVGAYGGVLGLEARVVVAPRLADTGYEVGVREAQLDVREVVGERRARESSDVLDHEGAGLKLTDDLSGRREHVSWVLGCHRLAAHREGLARRSA